MAQKKIINISSGIYTREIDLTVIQQNAGTFAGACLGLMEKGPAFQIITSANFDERTLRMGGLNPSFKSSYSAYEFLEQANNYKEVRILGLEGYNEEIQMIGNQNQGGYDKAFAIMYDFPSHPASPAGTLLEILDIVTNNTTTVVITADAQTVDNTFVDGDTVIIDGVTGVLECNGQFIVNNVVNTPGVNVVFEITIATPTSATWTGGGSVKARKPLIAAQETIACILKPRRISFTQYAEIDYVQISDTAQQDGTQGCTDDIFLMTIYYKGDQLVYTPKTVKCSLRPESNQYIANVFGLDPRDATKLQGGVAPLWVEFIWPSIEHKLSATGIKGYYYPGDLVGQPDRVTLNLVKGNITIQKNFTYPSYHISDINGVVITPTDVTFKVDTNHGFIINNPITLSNITGVIVGTEPIDGNWLIKAIPAPNQFTIKDLNGNTPIASGTFVPNPTAFVKKTFIPTWEKEVMNLGGYQEEIEFQTPITPWFISDFDSNGEVKRLFRLWSISDGESANTEIKFEITNINPDGNLGKGSFDILVRNFTDYDDKNREVYEAFANLTMDPKSSNYILRRIGDGEEFGLQSHFFFVELYKEDIIPSDALPYGIEGYPNINGIKAPDVLWTVNYDLSKPNTRQYLGLPNNDINMLEAVTRDNLSFKNLINYDAAVGIGFHLNPQMIDGTSPIYPILSAKYKLVEKSAYYVSNTNTTPVTGLNKSKRMKYVINLFGGFDGFNVYSQRKWDDTTSKDYEALIMGIEVLNDPESLDADFSVIITPDFDFQNHSAATEAVLDMVENGRGDALYIFDFDYGYTTGFYPEIVPNDAKIALNASNMKSSFAAVYYPDWQFEDTINNINPWVPPSILAFATIAYTATNENVFQPPAGSLRTVTQNLVRTRKRMKLSDREILKSANINPITVFPGSGYEITESRTTQKVFSARSFVHNRLLLGYAKKALNQTLRPILQQLNSGKALKDLLLDTVEPIFARIKRDNGLEDFKISINDDPNDRTTIYGKIEIIPLYPVERIIMDFVLKNGTFTFNQ
jgi:hypothetical protein